MNKIKLRNYLLMVVLNFLFVIIFIYCQYYKLKQFSTEIVDEVKKNALLIIKFGDYLNIGIISVFLILLIINLVLNKYLFKSKKWFINIVVITFIFEFIYIISFILISRVLP